MGLSNDLISQFAKVTKVDTNVNKESTVWATAVEYNGSIYVRFDGADRLTPISTTTNIKPGERVLVTIKNHSAIVTGNISSPTAGSNELRDVEHSMSDTMSSNNLEAIYGIFQSLEAKTAEFDNIESINADIEKLKAHYAELEYISAKDIEALNIEAEKIKAAFGEFEDIDVNVLEAINADIDNLIAYNANFTYVSAEVLKAVKANVKQLDVDKLSAKDADLTYANIDFANINMAAVEELFTKSGIIKDLVVGDQSITGELVGVTIKGDLIEGNTIKADKLVVKGEDGLFYKLNVDALGETTAKSDPKYQEGLDGSVIVAESITAEKVSVDDLVAFGATIGGFHITTDSLYSGAKESVDNTTRGIYMDGQFAVGDANNFLRYSVDDNGASKLEISANSIKIGTSGSSVDEVIKDAQTAIDKVKDIEQKIEDGNFSGEDATVLRIDSSRGTVFKNNQVNTVLSVVIYHGSQRITSIDELKATYGQNAYLEWSWQRMDDQRFGVITASDPRISNGGFTFTISADDVDTKVVFMCSLND